MFEVLLAGAHLQPESFRELSRIVEARTVLQSYAKAPFNQLEPRIHPWANKVSALDPMADRQEILRVSKGVVQEAEIEALLDALVLKVDEFSYRTTSEHLRIRYLLARVNSYVQRSFNVTQHTVDNLLVTKTPTNQSGYDIDHIFPKSQSRREFWAVSQEMNTRFGEQDRSSRALNAIGNLSLLRGVDNQFSSDDLPWTEEKLSSYATSELIICQLLSPSGLASIANHKPNEQPLADLGWPKGLSLNEWGEEQSLELRNFYAQTMRRSIANDLDHPE